LKLAVIQTGGKQYLVEEGSVISIEKLKGESKEGDTITFDDVLLTDDGKNSSVGAPTVSGGKVEGVVQEAGKGPKKVIFRYKAKSNRHKLKGHRQHFLKVKITKV
jgi:large subunit ribosomal protein L21